MGYIDDSRLAELAEPLVKVQLRPLPMSLLDG